MEYMEFVVPSDAEMRDAFGVLPEIVEDDPTVRSFRLASDAGDEALFSYDVLGRSFRVQVSSGGVTFVDLLRESATQLRVSAENGVFRVRVMIKSSGLSGELDVSVGPEIVVRDKLLMV
jgi:hypothetical protein